MPRLTPAQRQFGLGLTPIEKAFRPPQGMEDDPAYNDYARQRWADADFQDAQRAQARAILMEQEDKQAQRASEQQMADVEQRATEAMRGKSPDEIPNIIAQFPELARSKNLGGFTHFAQTVNPSAGQKTLAPSLRNKLKPHERQYFDEHFSQGGDAISAFDAAQLRGEHENGLVDMMKSGVPLDVIDKYRDRPMSPLEREAIVRQHAVAKGGKSTSPLQDAYELDLKMLYEDPDFLALQPVEKAKRVRDMRLAYELDKAQMAPQQPPAVATPAAEGGIPAASGAPQAVQQPATPAIQNLDLSKIPYAEREQYVADIEKQAKESEEINKKWYEAQTDLQSKLEKEIGTGNIGNTNYSKLRSFAEAVVNGDTVPQEITGPKAGYMGVGGAYTAVPVGAKVLSKLKLLGKPAFSEPGNRRVGAQEVTYDDLLKTWAENYLKTAPITAAPIAQPISQEEAAKSINLLDKHGIGR